jgi:hypothetical protein
VKDVLTVDDDDDDDAGAAASSSVSSKSTSIELEDDPGSYQLFRNKVQTILTLLALKETVLLVSQPGYGKTSLLRELLRGIGEYTDRNRYINTRVVVVDKNHEICGTGSFGRRFADPCEVSPDSGTGKNTPGMMNAMEKLTAGWVRRIFIFFPNLFSSFLCEILTAKVCARIIIPSSFFPQGGRGRSEQPGGNAGGKQVVPFWKSRLGDRARG